MKTKKEDIEDRVEAQRNKQKLVLLDGYKGSPDEFLEDCNNIDKEIDETLKLALA